MYQTAGYPSHPPHFANYNDYRSPPRTPTSNGVHSNFYSPRQYVYATTPTSGHTRRATGDNTTYKFTSATYTTPRKSSAYAGPEYSSPGYYTSAKSTPQRNSDYVSAAARKHSSTRHSTRVPADSHGKQQRRYSTSNKHHSSRAQYVYDEPSDRSYEYLPRYEQYETRPPPYTHYQSYHDPRTDGRYREQVNIYTSADPSQQKARPRRASHSSAKPTATHTTPHRRPSGATKPPQSPPKATDEDARRAGIPAGYSFKNWDPTEEPILLLGSVFDANSLGKWIYDWTVFYYGPATPMSEISGELWLLLIQLAGKIKRAEECRARIRRTASRDLVDEFLDSGERLWQRFNKLLKICETYMWRAAKKEQQGGKGGAKVQMGKNSGCEFVDSIFGRDRELERTEKLMTGMRLWSMRFDANCEAIIRNPSA